MFQDVDEPDRASLAGVGEHRLGVVELLLVDGSERVVSEEVVAAEARVRVWAGLHERQAAVPVRKRLAGAGGGCQFFRVS